MPGLLIPNEILSLSAQAARRLIHEGDGDAALLYLALLESAGDREKARAALKWNHTRLAECYDRLVRLELAEAAPVDSLPQPPALDTPPEYTKGDLLNALQQESQFPALCREAERCMGRPLGETDLRSLYTLYDFLALPTEVIFLLFNWCAGETTRKYGPGRTPRMGDIKREGFRWKRQGLDTVEGAEDFLKRQQQFSGRERELLPLLDIRDRLAIPREREYLTAWVEMGFSDDAIRLAYERTIFQKQKLHWGYMHSILRRWHAAGLHTAAQVRAGDAPPGQNRKKALSPSPQPGDGRQQGAAQLKKDVDWMEQFLRDQKGSPQSPQS